ncbi:MAG: hypothetical protein H8E24_05165 [Verrucomicrobia bacterium]|nr:hypothetical protein [Verrucomicrobiota bacterium]
MKILSDIWARHQFIKPAVVSSLLSEKSFGFIVDGDTNSTLPRALADSTVSIPCPHIETGLRSGNQVCRKRSIVSLTIMLLTCCSLMPKRPRRLCLRARIGRSTYMGMGIPPKRLPKQSLTIGE